MSWKIYTPAPLVEVLLEGLNLAGLRVFDPSAGDGRILDAALSCGAREVIGIDIDPQGPRVSQGDALSRPWPDCDIILGNPPWLRGHTASNKVKQALHRITGSREHELALAWVVLALESGKPFRFWLPLAALRGGSEQLLSRHTQRVGHGIRVLRELTWTRGAHAQAALIEGGPKIPPILIPPCPDLGVALAPGARQSRATDAGMPMIGGRSSVAKGTTKELVLPAHTRAILVPRTWPPNGVPQLREYESGEDTVVARAIPIIPEHTDRVFDPGLRAWVLAHAPQLPSGWLHVSRAMLLGPRHKKARSKAG